MNTKNDIMIGDYIQDDVTGCLYHIEGVMLTAGCPPEFTLMNKHRNIFTVDTLDGFTKVTEWDEFNIGVIN